MLKALSKIKLDSKNFEIVVLGDSHNLKKIIIPINLNLEFLMKDLITKRIY